MRLSALRLYVNAQRLQSFGSPGLSSLSGIERRNTHHLRGGVEPSIEGNHSRADTVANGEIDGVRYPDHEFKAPHDVDGRCDVFGDRF
jgi:hypothetical protein